MAYVNNVSVSIGTFSLFVSGAFLIPYYIMMFVCSIPLLLMELAIGQFTQRGPVGAMARLCPLFKGQTRSTQVSGCFSIEKHNSNE